MTEPITLELDLPPDLAALLQGFNQPLERSARELMVLELYRRAVLSSGKAAELLNMERFEFVRYASRLGIAFFDMTEDEWKTEADEDTEVPKSFLQTARELELDGSADWAEIISNH